MRILASALMDSIDQFLHAGYTSAYPRTLEPWSLMADGEPTLQLDMVQALQLTGDSAAAAVGQGGSALATGAASGSPELWAAAAAAGLGALGLALLHQRFGFRPRTALVVGALTGVLAVGHVSCDVVNGDTGPSSEDEKALPPPWDGVDLLPFADPEAATQAIMYGIIADGLANIDFAADALEHIQREVGLPTTTPTPGMAHALLSYGYDGWRNAFRLERGTAYDSYAYGSVNSYTVTSSGADGTFDTADDMTVRVAASADGSWDMNRWASFLREDDQGALTVLFHRWRGNHFEYLHQAEANALTESDLFDLFLEEDLEYWLEDLRSAHDAAAAASGEAPLLLQLYRNL